MAKKSSLKASCKEWWRQLHPKKAPGKEGATDQGSSSSMQDALPTAKFPSATPLPIGPPTSMLAMVDNAGSECKTSGILNVGEEAAKDPSLWDRAYDALAEEKGELVSQYENLLSRALKPNPQAIQSASEEQGAALVPNLIPHEDPAARQQKLKQIIEVGLQRMEDKKVRTTVLGHEIILSDVVAKAASAATWAEQLTKEAVKDVPYASIVMAGVSLILPLLKNPVAADAANSEGLTYVTLRMRYYAAMERSLFPEDMGLAKKDHFTALVVELYKQIIDFQVQSCLRFYRARTKNYLRGAVDYDDWRGMVQRIKKNDAEIISDVERNTSAESLLKLKDIARDADAVRTQLDGILSKIQELVDVNQDQSNILRRLDQNNIDECIRALHITDPRDDKSSIEKDKGGLLQGAFRWVLDSDEFKRWQNTQPESQLLWIKGDPGKGKTMLMCGIIEELEKPDPTSSNVTFFFCRATDARINNATAVLRGLIFLLVKRQPCLIWHIWHRYKDAGKKLFEDANAWQALSKIFGDILEDPKLQITHLVIDALDECTTDLERLLTLIVEKSSAYPKVKWIVSSRNWPEIERHLLPTTQKARLSLELNEKSVSAAVKLYIKHRVDQLAKTNKYKNDIRDAISSYLSLYANGTFLWVALVCKELETISGWHVRDMLTPEKFPPELSGLYKQMMDHISNSREARLCKNILAVVSAVQRPLALDELETFIDIPPDASGDDDALSEIIGLCGSFLSLRQRTIFFVHQSAKDYLVNNASDIIFPEGEEGVHYTIFSRSLRSMTSTLNREDIYDLSTPGYPAEEVKTPDPDPLSPVRYSCVYWVHHLLQCRHMKSTIRDLQEGGTVDKFFHTHFLRWLEALSLLKAMPQGVAAMLEMHNLLRSTHTTSLLTDRVLDASRFLQSHKWGIEKYPLQVYSSALIFSPFTSITRRQYQERNQSLLTVFPMVDKSWSACLQTLEGHSSTVNSVAFSPDGQVVASASHDNTVKLWDAETGAEKTTLEGHSRAITSVAFSPDGQVVASASHDNTVKLWDVETGAEKTTLEGHSGPVTSVAFSPGGQVVASASGDNTVKLWDAETGAEKTTLEGHSDRVRSVAFSPDGQVVVSTSHDNTVKLWDAETGAEKTTLEGHSGPVNSVAFSPNGQVVASASYDNTVKLWDVETGAEKTTLEGHSGPVTSVAFSPGGQVVASASHDNTAKLWESATAECLQTVEVGTALRKLNFAEDGLSLLTDVGAIAIGKKPAERTSERAAGPDSSLVGEHIQPNGNRLGYGISKDGCWVIRDGRNLLWLPADFRSGTSAVRDSVVAIVNGSGRVVIMQFA